MICPACSRDNAAGRRYCGGCGCNFVPGCDGCGFVNTQVDRFCGGCGLALQAAAQLAPALKRETTIAPRAACATSAAWAADELTALFHPVVPEPELAQLPEAGISQDDIDRLFGAGA